VDDDFLKNSLRQYKNQKIIKYFIVVQHHTPQRTTNHRHALHRGRTQWHLHHPTRATLPGKDLPQPHSCAAVAGWKNW